MTFNSNQCWYEINNEKIKIRNGIFTDNCVCCKFSIISRSYQQKGCGSRYCKDCFRKIKAKFYCPVCKDEDPSNIVHKKEDIFEDKAFKNDLLKMNIKCPDCKSEMCIMELEKHVRDKCSDGWKMCDRCKLMHKKQPTHECGELEEFMADYDTASHQRCDACWKELPDLEDHICKMNVQDKCPYGCQAEGDMDNHKTEAALKHLDKMWAVLKELKISDCKKADDSNEYKVWYDNTIRAIKNSLKFDNNFDKNMINIKKDLQTLKIQMNDEKTVQDEIVSNLLNQAAEFLNTSFDGTIMFRVDNFSKLREDAKSGDPMKIRIFSQPFYTSRFGYKMCLLLYPNGDSTVNGKALSVFLVIMKGNYDAMLRWPFAQRVTLTLIDQAENRSSLENISHTFYPSQTMASFGMPKTDMNVPAGVSSFFRFDDLVNKTHRYTKNNIVFIHGVVDCSDLHE